MLLNLKYSYSVRDAAKIGRFNKQPFFWGWWCVFCCGGLGCQEQWNLSTHPPDGGNIRSSSLWHNPQQHKSRWRNKLKTNIKQTCTAQRWDICMLEELEYYITTILRTTIMDQKLLGRESFKFVQCFFCFLFCFFPKYI